MKEIAYKARVGDLKGLDLTDGKSSEWAMKWLGKGFNHQRFDELYRFAHGPHGQGLDLSDRGAIDWALEHLDSKIAIERYSEFFQHANGKPGLDMSRDRSKQWALDRLEEVYNVVRFVTMRMFFQPCSA